MLPGPPRRSRLSIGRSLDTDGSLARPRVRGSRGSTVANGKRAPIIVVTDEYTGRPTRLANQKPNLPERGVSAAGRPPKQKQRYRCTPKLSTALLDMLRTAPSCREQRPRDN